MLPLLAVDALNIRMGRASEEIAVVEDVGFAIEKGGVFGLVGESGSGKTLTALSIMGLLPDGMRPSGSINFQDRNLLGLKGGDLRAIRGHSIAMVFQEPMTSLNPVLRIGYQISEAITTHLNVSESEAEKIALGLLRSVRIPSPEIRMREYPHQMSGGMRQRVMIAMAISCGPLLLIADEPTTALDVTIEAEILDLIRGLKTERGMSVLLITHDLGIIAENADKAAVMYAGRIVETCDVKELFNNPLHPYTMGLLGSLPRGRGKPLVPIAGNVPKPGELPSGCKFSDRCQYVIERCALFEPALKPLSDPSHLARCIRAGEIAYKP